MVHITRYSKLKIETGVRVGCECSRTRQRAQRFYDVRALRSEVPLLCGLRAMGSAAALPAADSFHVHVAEDGGVD